MLYCEVAHACDMQTRSDMHTWHNIPHVARLKEISEQTYDFAMVMYDKGNAIKEWHVAVRLMQFLRPGEVKLANILTVIAPSCTIAAASKDGLVIKMMTVLKSGIDADDYAVTECKSVQLLQQSGLSVHA
jgi:hypothetical protein